MEKRTLKFVGSEAPMSVAVVSTGLGRWAPAKRVAEIQTAGTSSKMRTAIAADVAFYMTYF
jgi:hypothetical protein